MNLELFYQTYGEGAPLIILHGLLGASGNWHTLAKNVFSERFQVFTLDLRNHGRSPHDDRFDYPSMVEDVRYFIAGRDLSPAIILGHSMGGKVAMWLALEHPDLVSKLVVVDMAPRAYPPHHTHILDALRNLDLSTYSSRSEIDRALSADLVDVGIRQFLLKNLSLSGSNTYSWKMNLPAIYDNYARINERIESTDTFTGPTLFIKGGTSNYITEKDRSDILKLFPTAQIRAIPDIGHWVHAEAPEKFAELVMQFAGS